MIEYILNPQIIESLGWTLLHSIWQGAAFAVLLVLILIGLRKYSAQSRYIVSVGVLCTFFLTVSATFWQQCQQANNSIELFANNYNGKAVAATKILSNTHDKLLQNNEGNTPKLLVNTNVSSIEKSSWVHSFKEYFNYHLPLLVTFWFLGILFLQLRFLGQLAYVQRLKHYGTHLFPDVWRDKIEELEGKLRIQKKVSYLTSIRVEAPMVIGWLKPVVLLPKQLFNSLSETEIYEVLAHELAHIRREDFIVNLMQTFLCNIFFFHPGVWWMSHRIDDEREHCCDDLAVAATGAVTSYAKTLINVSELQLSMRANPALAVALSGKSKNGKGSGFSSRIRRLFMVDNGTGTFREGFATACILMTALFLGAVATGKTVDTTDSRIIQENHITEYDSGNEAKRGLVKRDIKISNPLVRRTTITTSTTTEDNPIANDNPIDRPEKPVAPPFPDVSRIDALIMACEEGDIDFVKLLVNSGIDINEVGSEGFTPLMMSTSENASEIVEYLIKEGADVNAEVNGWTALIEAVDEGSLSCMKLLLEAGAKVNYYRKYGPTAVTMAASEGKLECLKLLRENGANIDGLGTSIPPLHIAAEEGNSKIIDYLISQKVNLDKKDPYERTALMYAASEGKTNIINILLSAGANNSIKDKNGATAKEYADEEGEYYPDNGYRVDKLINNSTKNNLPAIHKATLDGLIEKVESMVEQGTSINAVDDDGRTPLHIASGKNYNLDMLALIDLGADINRQDYQGRTPLMYAAAAGEGDAAALLVSRLADVNIEDENGMRAYDWSKKGDNRELEKFLGLITSADNNHNDNYSDVFESEIENSRQKRNQKIVQKEKAIVTQKTKKKEETFHVTESGSHLRQYNIEVNHRELMEAARRGTVEDFSELLEVGMSANAKDDTKQTPLMVAARSNRLDIAEFLIKMGADVNSSTVSGLTALHYAALENHGEMALLLIKNNANVDATMRYSSTDGNFSSDPLVWEYIGATPLLIAVESKNTEVISILMDAGANQNHILVRNEYKLNQSRKTYLYGSEVMGIDTDFLEQAELQISYDKWTPYNQALISDDATILSLFK